MAVLASQEEPATADIAALFTGELVAVVARHYAHSPPAVSAACFALTCIVRGAAADAVKYVRRPLLFHLDRTALLPAQAHAAALLRSSPKLIPAPPLSHPVCFPPARSSTS